MVQGAKCHFLEVSAEQLFKAVTAAKRVILCEEHPIVIQGLASQDWLGLHSLRSLKTSLIKATGPENPAWVMIESLLNSWPLSYLTE